MVTRILHLCVAIVIFACPLICRAGAMHGAAHKHVCSCCHKSCPANESTPSPSSQKDSCQCICGGAVIADAVQLDLDPLLSFFTHFAMPPVCDQVVATSANELAFTSPSPPGGENLGRALRNVLGSLLC